MQYIVLDLEWNQPVSYNSPAYKSVGSHLMFEMIQIGAVKVDDQLRVVDSFNRLICPVHYVQLHPRIAKITHITQEELCDADDFQTVVQDFAAWCGEDYVLLTWGCDDVSVLAQNLTFFKCTTELGTFYDIQPLFSQAMNCGKERKGLKAAMELLQINPDEEAMPFHNAVNDAYYTALVFSKLPEPQQVLNFPTNPKPLHHSDHTKRECQAILRVRSTRDALKNPALMNPPCPACGRRLTVTEGYVKQSDGKMMALADCPTHGLIFVKLQFTKNESGKRIVIRSAARAEEQAPAYVHTKHLQWAQKVAAQKESILSKIIKE